MAEETPREQAERAARESMAKAEAEKARNDRIVEKQRETERQNKESPSPSPTPGDKEKKN